MGFCREKKTIPCNKVPVWGGLLAGSRPPGRLLFFTPKSLLEAGCRLKARPARPPRVRRPHYDILTSVPSVLFHDRQNRILLPHPVHYRQGRYGSRPDRAEDTHWDRTVALQFLPERFAGRDRSAVERFRREARAVSALNHSNICTLYDVDMTDSQPFLVMEYLEGQTLWGADSQATSEPGGVA